MKKLILILSGMVLAMMMGLGVATDSAKGVSINTAKKAPPSFMFVLQAKQGEIITLEGKTFLGLRKADIDHVIAFSDRPYRIVKYITGTDLAKDWKIGKNSFESDPPNAVLIANGKKARIVVLGSMEVTGTLVVFKILGNVDTLVLTGVTLVIDMKTEVHLESAGKFKTDSTVGEGLSIDPRAHPSYTSGGSKIFDNEGQVVKFHKRFGGLKPK